MRWIRFHHEGSAQFCTLEAETITVFRGDMFGSSTPTGKTIELETVTLLTPCEPSKMICLWNNFHALAAKLDLTEPEEPLISSRPRTPFFPTVKQSGDPNPTTDPLSMKESSVS